MKAREVKRQKLVAQYAERKAALKKAALADADGNIDYEALTKLQKLPKNASRVRLHNRCSITGRPKGYMRQFGIPASRKQAGKRRHTNLRAIFPARLQKRKSESIKYCSEILNQFKHQKND